MAWFTQTVALPYGSFLANSSTNLNTYIDDNLQPVEPFNTRMKAAVDQLASFLREHPQLNVSKVVKSGSMGKGTAIKNQADIDLVVFLNGYNSMSELVRDRGAMLQRIEGYIRERRSYEMDIEDIYREMTSSNYGDYSTSLAQQQLDFVKAMPPNIKNLIRLVKYWKNTHLTGRTAPNSYAMELLVIHEWEKAGRPQRFNTDGAFKQIMTSLTSGHTIKAYWEENYRYADFKGRAAATTNGPLLLDPANPFQNVAAVFNWQDVSKMAGASLESPKLRCVQAGWN